MSVSCQQATTAWNEKDRAGASLILLADIFFTVPKTKRKRREPKFLAANPTKGTRIIGDVRVTGLGVEREVGRVQVGQQTHADEVDQIMDGNH